MFPAGGQRGTTVAVRVGGLNLLSKASLEMLGPGVEASGEVRRVERVWLEGPLLPLPDSQQAEDYPQDYGGTVTIAADASTGPRAWRVWTAQGAAGSLPFVVGDLPEIVEREVDGDPVPDSGHPAADDQRPDLSSRGCGPLDLPALGRPGADRHASMRRPAGIAARPLARSTGLRRPSGSPRPRPRPRCDARLAFVAPRTGPTPSRSTT